MRTGAVWDFKVDLLKADIETVNLGGTEYNFQAVANLHYGFVGRAAGIGADLLRIGAGAAQVQHLRTNPAAVGPMAYRNSAGRWYLTFYDQPFDAWWVLFGMFLYEQYGSDLDSLTETTFSQALEQFSQEYGPCPPLD